MTVALLDTNAVLLLLIGQTHTDWIGTRKPVSNFSMEEFEGLVALLETQAGFLTLPNILTEVSNLIGVGKRTTATAHLIEAFAQYVSVSEELVVDSHAVVAEPEFIRFGLTDTAILRLFERRAHFITADYGLFGKLTALGVTATNLRHFVKLGL